MRNVGVIKLIPLCNKTMQNVKALCVRLRMQHDALKPLPAGLFDQRIQECAANTQPTNGPTHRHATDMPIRQQASGSDCRTRLIKRHRMHRGRVQCIDFNFDGHFLLLHEHFQANRARLVAKIFPRAQSDCQSPSMMHCIDPKVNYVVAIMTQGGRHRMVACEQTPTPAR